MKNGLTAFKMATAEEGQWGRQENVYKSSES